MFAFINKVFLVRMTFFRCNLLNIYPSKCVLINNQECRASPEVININTNEPLFYPYSILVNKWSGSCNNINDPYAKLYPIN